MFPMRNLIVTIFIVLSHFGQSQTTLSTLNHQNANSGATCDSISLTISPAGFDTTSSSDINLNFTGVNLLGTNYTATITWGDNSITTHTGTAVSVNSGIIWTPVLTHNTTSTGWDTLTVILVEDNSSDSLVKNLLYMSNACTEIYFTGSVDCDGNGTVDSSAYLETPYLFNATDTIYALLSTGDSLFYFPSIIAGTYSVGYTGYYSPPIIAITPSTIVFPIGGAIPNVNILFTCPYQTCFSGIAFCDNNNNGIYNPLTEATIPNMPIHNTTSNSNGFFTANIGSTYPFSNGYYLNMPTTWLTANGYYSSLTYITLDSTNLDSNCISNTPLNIPIHCNLTNLDSVCFDGVLFEDLNYNGQFDSGETTFLNAPIIVNVDGNSHVIHTDASGNLSYSGVHIGGISSASLTVSQNWLNYNGFTTYGPIAVQNFNCDSSHTTNIPLSDPNFNSISNLFMSTTNGFACDTLTVSVSPIGYDTNATEDVLAYFPGLNLLNEQYSLVVGWGDNTSTTHIGTAINAGQSIVWSPALSHTYVNDSSYFISLSITKVSNQHTNQHGVFINYTTSCPYYVLEIINNIDCDADGTIDGTIHNVAQYPSFAYYYYLHYSSFYLYNATDTIFADSASSYPQFVYWPNTMPAGNYTLGIVQSALDSMDFSWGSSMPTNYVAMPNNGTIQSITNTFNCIQNQVCLNGYVYCDDNNNGIMDLGENTVNDVPVNINGYVNFSGSTYPTDSTDTLGHYNFPFTIYDSAYFNLNIDQTWLTANGYIATNTNFSFNYPSYNGSDSILDCNTNFNIPVICNAVASDSICVSGQVFCDINNNGILDTNETFIPNSPIIINLLNGSGSITCFSDSTGNYTYENYHPNVDSIEITIPNYWLINNGYNTISPVTVSTLDCSVNTNVAIDCNIPQPCDNNWIFINGVGPYYQNWTNTMAVTFGNSDYLFPGSIYTISIDFPSGSTFNPTGFSIGSYTLVGNTLSWTQTINGFDTLNLNFDIGAGIPDSTNHLYTATISGPNLDCDSTNNTNNYTSIVGASYDPNNKLVNLPAYINPAIQEQLVYTINFQNTGTAPAQDVFIEDQLNQYLDWSTLEVISKSHNMFYTIDANGKVTFTFPQIWLPDSTTNEALSHGYITYKIKENNSIPLNLPIENTAHIFFDLNPAIVTNTTRNTNTALGLTSHGQTVNVKLYPNPTSGQLVIVSNELIKTIQIFDLSGKLVFKSANLYMQANLDLTHLSKGMYQIRTTTVAGTNTKKLILK